MKKEIIIKRIEENKLYLIVDDKSTGLEKSYNHVIDWKNHNNEYILLYLFGSKENYRKKLEVLYGHKITRGDWPVFNNPNTPVLEWLVEEIHEFNKQFNKTSQILILL